MSGYVRIRDAQCAAVDNSSVFAIDSKIAAYDYSRVTAIGGSHVDAHDMSTVIAMERSCVVARNMSRVMAYDNSSIFATRHVAVTIMPGFTGFVSGGTRINLRSTGEGVAGVEDWLEYYAIPTETHGNKRTVRLYRAYTTADKLKEKKRRGDLSVSRNAIEVLSGSGRTKRAYIEREHLGANGLTLYATVGHAARSVRFPTGFLSCPVAVDDIILNDVSTAYMPSVTARRLCGPAILVNVFGHPL